MAELLLKFTDNDGMDQIISVYKDRFTVGRHSENDLTIADGRLSRDHLKIERRAGAFFVSDLGSSNGTKLNGRVVAESVPVGNGDELDLGGVAIKVEIVESYSAAESDVESISKPAPFAATAAPANAAATGNGGIPTSVFYITPLIGIGILLIGVLAFFAFSGRKTTDYNSNNIYSSNRDSDTPKNRQQSNSDLGSTSGSPTANDNSRLVVSPANSIDSNSSVLPPTPATSGSDITERNAKTFLRAIAQKDPSAFLTGERAQKVDVKIKQLSSSPALADNINLAKKNGSQIAALANARGLRPQLLAAAVLAKMGASRGDVVQTAQTMADVLGKLRTPIGNELSDEVLLMIAAYDQGASGNFGKLPTTLQGLKAQNNARDIRTIWFLQKNGTITQAEFDFALQFLAVGTIAQKPRDFGVNAEPLTF